MDIIYPFFSDDNTLKPDHAMHKWAVLLEEGFAANGHSMRTALSYKEWLTDAGFVDVTVVKEKWPTTSWPKDPKYKQVGMWTYENGVAALQALSLAIFTRPKDEGGLGWRMEEVELLLAQVRKDFKDRSIHAYWPM